jgi:MFS family permease
VANVMYGDLRWGPEHPPLAKILAGAGMALGGVRTTPPPASPAGFEQADLGQQVLFFSRNSPRHVLWVARLPLIGLTVLFGLVVFGFATDLFGAAGGALAVAVYSVCPTVIAHGRLVTTDMAGAGFLLLTAWLLYRAAHRSWPWLVAAGVAYGLSLSSKSNALLVAPVVFFLAVVAADRQRSRAGRTGGRSQAVAAAQAVGVIAAAFVVVWVVYLALDPHLRFARPPASRSTNEAIDRLTNLLPLPRPYRSGLRDAGAIGGGSSAFLFGRRYLGGTPEFFPSLLLIKTPLASLALWVLGIVATIRSKDRRIDVAAFVGALPAAILLIGIASSLNIGIRHVIAVPLFMAVVVGGAVHLAWPRMRTVLVGLVVLAGASTWSQFPSYIAYTNEAFGGPSHAYRLMSDSNVDWGQDLIRLRTYLADHTRPDPVWLLYFGNVPASAYGIRSRSLLDADPAVVHGRVAMSVTARNTFGLDRFTKGRRPVAQVGHSILIYDLP